MTTYDVNSSTNVVSINVTLAYGPPRLLLVFRMYRFVTQLAQPYTFAVVGLIVALLLVRRRTAGRRRGLTIALCCAGLLYLLSLPPVCHVVLGSLEWQFAPLAAAPDDAPAMVVLGGGARAVRCERAASLYRRDVHTLVLASGGLTHADAPAEAVPIRDALVRMGVSPTAVVMETQASSTYENAVFCAAILRERGVGRVVLVTDAVHMPRAVACFRRQGIDVVPAPCDWMAQRMDWHEPQYYLPKAGAACHTDYAVREWLGLLWYWVRDRL